MSADNPQVPTPGAPPDGLEASLVGEVLDGRYRIIRKLGEGGMGEVYAAEHVHIEKRFAIKLLRPEIVSNAEAVQRFRQEARSASSIGHRNIIAIEDFGTLNDGRIYMCMEFLNGAALNDLITTPQPVDRLLNILIQTGHGLAAAHAKGIVHRDMKPENIFVTTTPNHEDIPKLLDFGIAKVAGNDGQNNLTRTGTIFGTPFYMAPEQALGNPVDARTDVYAMGVIMYEVFAGSLPFQGESFMGILTQHITTEPEPVAQRAQKAGRTLPPGLAEIVTQCLQKNPAQRFQTMDELVNALVTIYRGIAGPGMSTYMEAFPVNPTSAHRAVPTPGPMTAPHGGIAPTVGPGGPHAPHAPHPPTGPYPHAHPPPSGPMPPVSPSGSGYAYDPNASGLVPPRKSKAGLIIAIVAILAIGGGLAAFLIVTSQQEDGGTTTAGNDDSGSDEGSDEHPDDDRGSNHSGSDGSNESNGSNDSGSNEAGSDDPGSNHAGSDDPGSNGSNGSNLIDPPESIDAGVLAPEGVQVMLLLKNVGGVFDVLEDGTKIFEGPGKITIPKGGKRTVTIEVRGYEPKTVVVTDKKPRVEIRLKRLGPKPCTASSCPTGKICSPSGRCVAKPRTCPEVPCGAGFTCNAGKCVKRVRKPLDCSKVPLDWKDVRCKTQYCNGHPNDTRCLLED